MSVVMKNSTSLRNTRRLTSYAKPLPRLSSTSEHEDEEKYEVIVVGAGPAGLFLTLLLARYGLSDSSLLCIDAKTSGVVYGHADGISGRTLEVFKTLGLVDEILNTGCRFCEEFTWSSDVEGTGIRRVSHKPHFLAPTRFGVDTITINQGRIERILQDDLAKYSNRGVERASRLVDVKIDTEGDANFPVLAVIENEGRQRRVRSKYLVGADGAHSRVRQCMGVRMEGDSTDDLWGVVDFVADTDFPDIRRIGHVYTPNGNVLQIPRERNSDGHYLTRLYIEMSTKALPPTAAEPQKNHEDKGRPAKAEIIRVDQKKNVKLENIMDRASKIYHPYYIRPMAGTEPEWWTAYQVGQRVAERLVQKDCQESPRIFLVGDACHTHSPKLGQGMNVSMIDSYDLSWKLMYCLNSLASNPLELLETYSIDRHENAWMLIDIDKRWYTSRYINQPVAPEEVEAELAAFVSGCGVQYSEGLLTTNLAKHTARQNPISGTDYRNGILHPGRRIFPISVTRFADGCPQNLHDDLPSDGHFRIVTFASTDLLSDRGRSVTSLTRICKHTIPQFLMGMVELIVLHPLDGRSFEWSAIPQCVKQQAEMQFHNANEKAYATLGIDRDTGAVAVVRPDGFVGLVADLTEIDAVELYLKRILKVQG